MYNRFSVLMLIVCFLLGLAEVTGAMDRLRKVERQIRRPKAPASAPQKPAAPVRQTPTSPPSYPEAEHASG